jgi:hypothetical protein
MANTLIAAEERSLSPDEVAHLDRRRRRGHLFLVMGFQTFIIGTLVLLWAGQDLQYSPGWYHPMFYWDVILYGTSAFCFIRGLALRRGMNEFFSY